jgi:hypothetical protein
MEKLQWFKACLALVLVYAFLAGNVYAETLIESSVESRLYLLFQVQESDLQGMLPDPWQVSPLAAGPAKGSNLNVIFVQPLLAETPDGKPVPTAALSRYVVVTVPVKHAVTKEESSLVIRIYSTDPTSNLGHVKSAIKADIRREFTQKFENIEPGNGSDLWEMQEASGGAIKVQFMYKRAALNRAKRELTVRFATDPNDVFLYRVDQSTELLKSEVVGVSQLQNYEFRSTVPELAKVLNDNAKLVSVLEIPSYILQVAKP